MAPHVPEEVDVFTIPHSRMKELVNDYAQMIKKTNFSSDTDLELLLESLLRTFMEFKYHEQIENQLIMKKLKNRLKQLSIQNAAVCNCHNDDDLGRMMSFIKAGYKSKTAQDRVNFGLKLVKALEDFTETFIPHMKEEEEVFQPMLLQYFGYDELCDLKKKVIQQHITKEQQLLLEQAALYKENKAKDLKKENADVGKERTPCCEASASAKEKYNETIDRPSDQCCIDDLPPELKLRILSYVKPVDLCRMSCVNSEWKVLSKDPQLWPELYPVMWAKGNWRVGGEGCEGCEDSEDEEDLSTLTDSDLYAELDIDADVDETEPDIVTEVKREAEILLGLVKYIFPSAGAGTKKLILKNSRALTNTTLNRILQHCPNLEFLDLTQTRTSDAGLKRIGKHGCGSRLKQVILSGCVNITDATLLRLAVAQHQSHRGNKITFDEEEKGATDILESRIPLVKMKRRILEKVDPAKIEVSCCMDSGGGPSVCCKEEGKQEGSRYEADVQKAYDPKPKASVSKEEKNISNKQTCNDLSKGQGICDNGQLESSPIECENDGKYDLDCLCEMYYRECEILIDGGCEIQTHHCRRNGPALSRDTLTQHPSDINEKMGKNPQKSGKPPMLVERTSEEDTSQKSGRFGKANPLHRKEEERSEVIETCGHKCCTDAEESVDVTAIEECVPVTSDSTMLTSAGSHTNPKQTEPASYGLRHLNFSGCFQITDIGLRALGAIGSYPYLSHLDLSGCLRVTGEGLSVLVEACPNLEPASLYYCDNIEDGPHADQASGCQNLECGNRVCCRSGQ